MGDNIALKKLKMHYAKMAGKLKNFCFKALIVKTNQQKAMKMLESEAGQRLKAFLAGKLASCLRKVYQGLIRNHQRIEAENMKNNDSAKKIALLLEKLARGIVARQFSAFVRFWNLAKEERAAEAALNERLALMSDLNKAKLRVFLDGKRLGKMSSFFSHWKNIWMNRELIELYEMLEEEERLRKAAEDELARLTGDEAGAQDATAAVDSQVGELNSQTRSAEAAFRQLNMDLKKLLKKIKELTGDLKEESEATAAGKDKLAAQRAELAKLTAIRDELSGELMGIAGEVGGVHKETDY